MPVGLPLKTTYANGDVFSASDINDTNGTINLIGQTTNFYAGKNAVINGDFSVNQRGFSSTTSNATYTFDRWRTDFVGGTVTYSRQSFTPGAAPVVGYESTNFARVVVSGQTNTGGDFALWNQRIENVRTDAGQTVTISFWAKAASGTPKMSASLEQNFGSGGSSTVYVYGSAPTISTSWARYSITIAVPSISGKTIGTSSFLSLNIEASNAYNTNLGFQNGTFDIWGVQLEAGSVATAFQTATGTIQGELAACQRYYYRDSAANSSSTYKYFANTTDENNGTGSTLSSYFLPVVMRTSPSFNPSGNFMVYRAGIVAATSLSLDASSTSVIGISSNGLTGRTLGLGGNLRANNNNTAFLEFSAEL
jgi:hypothetical protein